MRRVTSPVETVERVTVSRLVAGEELLGGVDGDVDGIELAIACGGRDHPASAGDDADDFEGCVVHGYRFADGVAVAEEALGGDAAQDGYLVTPAVLFGGEEVAVGEDPCSANLREGRLFASELGGPALVGIGGGGVFVHTSGYG